MFAVSAADVKSGTFDNGVRSAFVPAGLAEATKRGTYKPEPLVLHVAAGDCVTVTLKNERASGRVSFHADGLLRDPASSGINVGFTPEQTGCRRARPGRTGSTPTRPSSAPR